MVNISSNSSDSSSSSSSCTSSKRKGMKRRLFASVFHSLGMCKEFYTYRYYFIYRWHILSFDFVLNLESGNKKWRNI